jgi:glycosyltransferase involved in cell wall biosynthesis
LSALSVVLPVFNGETFLDAAIASIRGQTFGGFELLVIDDGSQDASAAIAGGHAAQDQRVRVLANPGKGLVAALNFGITQATAPLIARMDADDIALPERFARQMARITAEPDLLALGTGTFRIDAAGNRLHATVPPVEPSEVAEVLQRVNPMAHPTVVMRRTAVETVGSYRPAYLRAEDYDLWLRLAERGKLANLAEPLLEYRIAGAFRPDVFSRQILSEMAARAAARLRRGGRPDPTGGWHDIDSEQLDALGIRPGEVAREIARRALHTARLHRKMKDSEGVKAAMRLADQQPRSSIGETLKYAIRRARVYL